MENFFNSNGHFRDDLIKEVKNLIKENGNDLVEKIFKENFIGKHSIDLVSVIIDYIKEKIFSVNLTNILDELEDNNFLTTLLYANEKRNILSFNSIDCIKNNYLKLRKKNEEKKYEP